MPFQASDTAPGVATVRSVCICWVHLMLFSALECLL